MNPNELLRIVDTGLTMKYMLELEFQLDAIDYSRDDFVHADMDPATFARVMRERGESIWTLMMDFLQQELARAQNGEPSRGLSMAELAAAFASPDRARHLKLLLAAQFHEIEDLFTAATKSRSACCVARCAAATTACASSTAPGTWRTSKSDSSATSASRRPTTPGSSRGIWKASSERHTLFFRRALRVTR